MEPSKKKITREQALSAHIECCPYMTAQMGEPISEAGFNKQTARCGLGKLYCIENKCFYIDLFLVVNCFQTLYLWPTDNNYHNKPCDRCGVVNCFQTLYLWPTDNNERKYMRSFVRVVNCFQTLYLWPTDNNHASCADRFIGVVNCFQTLYLWPTDNNVYFVLPR